MMRPCSAALSSLATLAMVSVATALTLHVPGDYPSIKSAIAAAALGDTVEIACGTYHEHDITVSRDLVLRSATGLPDCVTVDGDSLGCVLIGTPRSLLTIEGLTITRAITTALFLPSMNGVVLHHCILRDNQGDYPAALFCAQVSALTIENCDFINNRSNYSDGAFGAEGDTCAIQGCTFTGNSAAEVNGVGYWTGPGTISHCSFDGNSAPTVGGLSVSEGAHVSDCSFTGNVATNYTGALNVSGLGYGYAEVVNTVFQGNSGGPLAGAVRVKYVGLAQFTGCRFEDNSASVAGALLATFHSVVRMEQCLFQGNGADHGAAIAVDHSVAHVNGGTFFSNVAQTTGADAWFDRFSQVSFYGSTMCRDQGSAPGGVIWFDGGPDSRLSIQRSILAFSQGAAPVYRNGWGNSLIVQCTDVFGNEGGDWVSTLHAYQDQGFNLTADPMFCDMPSGVFTLNALSMCAPDHSGSCGLIGSQPVGCEGTGVGGSRDGVVAFDVRILPNPARAQVSLSIVGARAAVRMDIFDVAGRRVRTLRWSVSDGGGRGMLTWDRTDEAGKRVANGIYFVRASDGGRVLSRRLVLVR